MNIFQLAPNDQAVYYLGFIFGSVGNVLTPTGGGGSITIGIVGTMLKVLNLTALTVGVLVVVYITVVGVLATAHEGQFMGKDWSGLWVPIKTVLGVVALFPSGSGYSIIQILIMWIVIQGVAAADKMWTTVLNYIQYAGSPYATVSVPTVSLQQPMQTLFQGMMCQANAAHNSDYKVNGDFVYFCHSGNSSPGCSSGPNLTLATTGGSYPMGISNGTVNDGSCGTLSYCDQNSACTDTGSLSCAICKGQQLALQSIVTYFSSLSNNFSNADDTYLQFYGSGQKAPAGFIQQFCSDNQISQNACCYQKPGISQIASTCPNSAQSVLPAPSDIYRTPADYTNTSEQAMKNLYWPYVMKPLVTVGKLSPDIIKISDNLYADAIANAFTTWLATQPQSLSGWQQDAQQTGWLLAGSYYFKMSSMNGDNQQLAMPIFAVSGSDPYTQVGNALHAYRNNYGAASALLGTISQAASGTQSNFAAATGGSSLSGVSSAISNGASDVAGLFMQMVQGSKPGEMQTNVLANLQHFGAALLDTADAIWLAFLIITTVIGMSIGWSALVLGSGPLNPMSIGWVSVTLVVVPIVLALLAFLYATGGMLAVYVPLIPYVIYTMGAIGWMIGVIEAMVAGPLIALGILSPGKGGHEILGRAEPALMGMFGLFLRPTLMVVGMVLAMMLSAAAVTLLNSTFAGVVGEIVGKNPAPSITLFMLAAYVGLVVSVLNKCFALISIIPDKALTWMGGQHAPGGGHGDASEGLKTAEGKVGGAASSAGSAAGSATKGVSKLAGDKANKISGLAQQQDDTEINTMDKNKEGGSGDLSVKKKG